MSLSKLQLDLLALKLAVLKERVAADLQVYKEKENLSKSVLSPGNSNLPIPSLQSEDIVALTTRLSLLMDRLETKDDVTTKSSNTADMIQQLTLQNAQLHSILMANLLRDGVGISTVFEHTNRKGARQSDMENIESTFNNRDAGFFRNSTSAASVVDNEHCTPEIKIMNSKLKQNERNPKKFRSAVLAVISVMRFIRAGNLFRRSATKVARVLATAETQTILMFKELKPFFKAIELIIVASSKEGINFVFKETFTNPKRKGITAQEKMAIAAEFIINAIENITVQAIRNRFGNYSEVLRVFDYFNSLNVEYPQKYLWTVESRNLEATSKLSNRPSSFGNQNADSQPVARTLLLHFLAKTLLLKVLCDPIGQKIFDKRNAIIEMNMVAMSLYLFQAIQLASFDGELDDTDTVEFNERLPVGDFKSTWTSPQLISSIQSWAVRLKDWAKTVLKDLKS
ncbi:hypothetical protein HK100_004983 [Physocladia obscura]|uniref:Uncharacterized protein n=1 Tax=Physocladia obscura TaxID=109957 RepID=A0AAD5X9L9_9FUNG|nr:hypothetical protein HK100_004983 [Physocladia obscura]